MVTVTQEAAKGIDTLPVLGTHTSPLDTLVYINTGASVWSEAQPWRWTGASDVPLHHLTSILAVGIEAISGGSTASILVQCVSVQTVTLVASCCVHTAMLTRPGPQPTLI